MREIAQATLLLSVLALAGGAAVAQSAAPKIDPAWLTVDSAARVARFALIGGHGTANSGLNFNGFKSGGLTLTVPKGWTVVIQFVNRDPNLPHSAAVIPEATSPPLGPVPPAFPRAATKSQETGLPSEGQDEFRFAASRAGAYWMFCAVPGHGAAGMWIRLKVSDSAARPELTPTS